MSFSGDRFLVNEKSLELNITHELMSDMNALAVGFSQGQEKVIGGDVSLSPVGSPVGKPLILQFKRPEGEGFPPTIGVFRINTNRTTTHPPTQHKALDELSRHTDLCDVYYVFPLVFRNREFVRSFGRLSDQSVYVPPCNLTDCVSVRSRNWMNEPHKVTVGPPPTSAIQIRSSEVGECHGLSKRELLKKLSSETDREKDQTPEGNSDLLTEHIEGTLKKMEQVLTKAEVVYSTEHTVNFFLRSKRKSLHYVPLTVRLKGRKE